MTALLSNPENIRPEDFIIQDCKSIKLEINKIYNGWLIELKDKKIYAKTPEEMREVIDKIITKLVKV